ncbi:Uncharacterised protein [Streptococcus pneumoniae]|nr:Uncharacterised protein [Streptococcus pneumoniae]
MVVDKSHRLVRLEFNQAICENATKVIVCASLTGFKEILVETNIDKVKVFFRFFEIVQIGFLVWVPKFTKNIEIVTVFFLHIADEVAHKERVNMLNGIQTETSYTSRFHEPISPVIDVLDDFRMFKV